MDVKMAMVQVEISQQLLQWLLWKFGSNIPGPQRMNTSHPVEPDPPDGCNTEPSGKVPLEPVFKCLSCTWF